MKHLPSALAAVAAGALLVAPAAEARPDGAKVSRGATELTLAGALPGGVSIAAARPAVVTPGAALRLPITKGRVGATGGRIDHVGGFVLSTPQARVVVRGLRLTVSPDGASLAAKVGRERVTLATVEGAELVPAGGTVTMSDASVTLTDAGADALDAALGLEDAFSGGTSLGELDLSARLVGKGVKAKKGKPAKADRAEAGTHRGKGRGHGRKG